MNDADGSSSAAHGAHQPELPEPRGFLNRLLFWQDEEDDDEDGHPPHMNGMPRHSLGALRRIRVEDVAIPKREITAIQVDASLGDLVALFRDSGFTRLPVYDGTLDMPLGMVHL